MFIAKRISEPLVGHQRLQFHTTSGSLFSKSRHQPIVKNSCNCIVPLGELEHMVSLSSYGATDPLKIRDTAVRIPNW